MPAEVDHRTAGLVAPFLGEEDPDVLARGKAVSILGATHRLRIGKEEATGVLVLSWTWLLA